MATAIRAIPRPVTVEVRADGHLLGRFVLPHQGEGLAAITVANAKEGVAYQCPQWDPQTDGEWRVVPWDVLSRAPS
jgi:hypothetical protein